MATGVEIKKPKSSKKNAYARRKITLIDIFLNSLSKIPCIASLGLKPNLAWYRKINPNIAIQQPRKKGTVLGVFA
jgi:hypothetical protein